MRLSRSLGPLSVAMILAVVPICRSADDAANNPLKDKNRSKAGTVYVLPVEQELADGMKDLRKLSVKLAMDAKQRHELENKLRIAKGAISQWEHQRRQLYEEYTKLTDITQKNDHVARVNVLDSKLTEANTIRTDLEKQLNGLGADEKTQFVNSVLDLSVKVDKAGDDYKSVANDAEVKAELEKSAQPGKPKMKLGPSSEFTANANQLKRWSKDVSSDVIAIKNERGVPNVEVTLNGTVIREMVVDSGAGIICLTADLAAELKMVPTDKDETLHMVLADGKQVDAKHMVLKSVRVGQFTVADVDCAVFPATLAAAQPLLGQTFLSNFVFKMDSTAGELHLAVIAGNAKVTTVGGAKDKKPAASAGDK